MKSNYPENSVYFVILPKEVQHDVKLYERAASAHSLVLAFHFMPFPGLGHIERVGEGRRWVPLGD